MNSYKDKNGFYHDKPCIDGEPSSNNPLIYTAYARALGINTITEHFPHIYRLTGDFFFSRVFCKDEYPPPFSKDEFLGMVCLLCNTFNISSNNWNFSHYHKVTHPLRTLKAMWYLRNKHRNTVWKEKIYDAYPIAFSVPWKMRYFTEKFIYGKSSLRYWLAFHFGIITTFLFSSAGSKNMLWLQLHHLNHPAIKLIDKEKNFMEYFGEEHVFNTNKSIK
jgi:hypothetical protein